MLALNLTHKDDRRMCETECSATSLSVWDYPECAGRQASSVSIPEHTTPHRVAAPQGCATRRQRCWRCIATPSAICQRWMQRRALLQRYGTTLILSLCRSWGAEIDQVDAIKSRSSPSLPFRNLFACSKACVSHDKAGTCACTTVLRCH